MPQPPENHGFPDWGHKPPVTAPQPEHVTDHNPLPRHEHGDDHHGNDRDHGHDHQPPPPPVVPGANWHDPWLDHGNHRLPPPNPDIFVQGDNNTVVIVNNVTNVNNTVVNGPSNLYLTNFVTGQTLNFSGIGYGTPYALPSGWCGGSAGYWGWSAGIGGAYVGGGVFNASASCGYVPYVPPPAPLVIYSAGYQPYYVDNYVTVPDCGCVYANNTYFFGQQQQVTLPGQSQPQSVFVPTSWSPNIVTQPPSSGVPPYFYETGHVPSWWSQYWLVVVVVVVAGVGATGAFVWERRRRQTYVSP